MSDLDISVDSILGQLRTWAGLPKYSVERRLDLFLAPFIPLYLADKLGCPGAIELVVPEFPIRHTANYQTVNVDYLLLRRDQPTWFLVELKTDATSVGEEQAEIYQRAAFRFPPPFKLPMQRLLDDLPDVKEHSRHRRLKRKYDYLIGLLEKHRAFQDAPVKVVYVSPNAPRRKPWRHIRLSSLASWVPARNEDQALWGHVAVLLAQLHDGAPARGTSVDDLGIGMGSATVERVIRDRETHAWTSVVMRFQSGCMPEPDPRRPEALWTVPLGRARIARDEYLAAEARQEEEQWRCRD